MGALPFTEAQFLGVFAEYNETLWPAEALLWLLTAFALALLATRQARGRLIGGLLALHWLWTGGVYHLGYFRAINPAARIFGAAFLVEGALFLWVGAIKGRLDFHWGRSPRQVLSIALACYSLLYPALVAASGFDWPAMPAFAVPCPTTLLTIGLLLALPPGSHRSLGIIPILWCIVAGSAAVLFRVLPDFVLFAAGALLLVYLVAPRLAVWRAQPRAA